MSGERYIKATLGSVAAPVFVSLELAAALLAYEDPATGKQMPLKAVQKRVTGEVRTDDDCSTLVHTVVDAETVVLVDAAGAANKTYTLKVAYEEWSGETGAEDTKPGRFSLKFIGDWPSVT